MLRVAEQRDQLGDAVQGGLDGVLGTPGEDLAAARTEAEQTQRKLANESFLAKAPADVVAKTRDRLAAAQAGIDRITGRLAALPGSASRAQGVSAD